jgi:NAD(P)-dependent dehydrogenase (short-subunit alcohol dehydrogenase family)
MIDLSQKVVLVTGGSRGIGAVTVRTLVQAGADVVLHYAHGHAEAAAIAQSIARSIAPDRVHLVQADLSVPQAAMDVWRQAIAWKGQVDVLVNNAAVMPAAGVEGAIEEWSAAWQTTLQVNLVAVADLCREAIRHYQSRRAGGVIINLASRAAFRGDGPEYMHYAASKGGVVALTRSIARGFAKDNILAFAVAPGFVRTERIEQVMQERGEAYVTRDIPMGEPAPPQDVANVIAFLASGLAPHMTGTTIDINGASYVR